jgi:hypothetical protein
MHFPESKQRNGVLLQKVSIQDAAEQASKPEAAENRDCGKVRGVRSGVAK